jgi:APA family basic amino acid/polyamine antiporter
MANDGLLPPWVARIHPRFRTPWITQIVVGVAVAIPASFLTVREAASLVSIGTLLAFAIVSAGVLVLRIRDPNLHRPFRTPWVWFVAPMGVISALYLMQGLPLRTWMRLLIWLAIGLVVYFLYGVRASKLARAPTP